MGLTRHEILSLTLAEFNLRFVGYKRRIENDWDIARNTWAYIVKFGGMGVKEGQKIDPVKLYPLEYRDKGERVIVKRVKNIKEAVALLNKF